MNTEEQNSINIEYLIYTEEYKTELLSAISEILDEVNAHNKQENIKLWVG